MHIDESVRGAGESTGRGAGAAGRAASGWGLLGVTLLFGSATFRLGARGVHTVRGGLEPLEWLALVLLTALFVYAEGVRALQRRYVPHVFRRADRLRLERRRAYRLLAPLYALSLIGGPTRTTLGAWLGTSTIVVAVLVVGRFPEPWRGITDLAVAAALGWGLAALLVRWVRGSPDRPPAVAEKAA